MQPNSTKHARYTRKSSRYNKPFQSIPKKPSFTLAPETTKESQTVTMDNPEVADYHTGFAGGSAPFDAKTTEDKHLATTASKRQQLDFVEEKKIEETEETNADQSGKFRAYPAHPVTPFQEKHMTECLDVQAGNCAKTVLFYNMLNQGQKRGKETKILALDCERILTKKGDRLARVSIVNFYGNIVFDTLIKPWAKVEDYREWITGIKSCDLKHAPSYPKVAPILKKILNDKVVVGHSLKEDFAHLKLNPDEYSCEIRDISEISFFKRVKAQGSPVAVCHKENCSSPSTCHHVGPYNPFAAGEKRKLKELAEEFLNAKIQTGHHSSIIDARVALALYRTFQMYIEQENFSPQAVQAQVEFEELRRQNNEIRPQELMTDIEDFGMSPIPLQDTTQAMILASMAGQHPPQQPISQTSLLDFAFQHQELQSQQQEGCGRNGSLRPPLTSIAKHSKYVPSLLSVPKFEELMPCGNDSLF